MLRSLIGRITFPVGLAKMAGWLGFTFLVAPIAVVAPLAFNAGDGLSYPLQGASLKWFSALFVDYPWLLALKNSFIVAIAVTILATILGTSAAYGLSLAKFRMKPLIMAVIMAPALVPVVIVALACYFAFSNIGMVGNLYAVVVGHTVIAVPMVFITVTATLKGFNPVLIKAASSLGASPMRAFCTVALPIISPGVLAGAVFAFVTSFDEVVIALFLTGPGQITVPRQLFSDLRNQLTPSIVALSLLLTLISAIFIIVAGYLQKRAGIASSQNSGGILSS